MEHIQKFFKGMLQDIAKSNFPEDAYYEAHNMSLVSSQGLSTGVLRNIEGNSLDFSIPSTSNVSEIVLAPGTIPGTTSSTLTINGVTNLITFGSTIEDTYKAISDTINSSTNWTSIGIQAAYSGTHVVIFSGYLNNTLITSTITASGPAPVFVINNSYVLATSSPKLLTWETIRDDIYLLTTDSISTTPSNPGQVWKITYNKSTFVYTISLVYNNNLNFSLAYPIANPGAIKGNYEIPTVQKLYWTDNQETPKVLNIVDPNAMALEPTEIEWSPDNSTSVPSLRSINTGGNVKTGVYTTSYKLYDTGGSSTSFSPESNPVVIIKQPESANFMQYLAEAPGVNSGKSITWRIQEIDQEYQRIQICVLYRQNKDDLPEITVIEDKPLNGISSLDFTYTGNENILTLTLDQFNEQNIVFDTVKTISSKFNFLFPGNVSYSDFDIQNFDTRAYRFDYTGVSKVQDTAGTQITLNPGTGTYPDEWGVPEKHDAINPDQSPYSRNNYLYKLTPRAGLPVFGGEGPNISYEFITENDSVDTTIGSNRHNLDINHLSATPVDLPYFALDKASRTRDLLWSTEQYPQVNTFEDYHSPYTVSSLKQYQRDETYRFAIVFYSKKGIPSFAKWIADIRFPHVYMPDSTITPTGPDSGRRVFFPYFKGQAPGDASVMIPMGIKFTVNTSSIASQISGFSIVRVQREEDDKSVVSQGVFYPAFEKFIGSTHDATYALPADIFWNQGTPGLSTSDLYAVDTTFGSYNSPESLFKNSHEYRPGDYLDVVCLARETANAELSSTDSTGASLGKYKKVSKYNDINTNKVPGSILINKKYQLTNAIMAENVLTSGTQSHNYGADMGLSDFYNKSGSTDQTNSGAGGRTLMLAGDFSNIFPVQDGVTSGFLPNIPIYGPAHGNFGPNIYIANYKRIDSIQASQYGGQSYNARSLNEYISTGHYQSIQGGVQTGYIFGGDSYICMFDNIKIFPAIYNGVSIFNPLPVYGGLFKGNIVPIETTLNINLRIGFLNSTAQGTSITNGSGVLNKEYLIGTSTASTIDTQEVFSLYDYVNAEKDTIKFFPKPDPYVPRNKFDTRIHASQKKTPGELTDSWTVFKIDDKIDADSTQGPLNNLVISKDTMYGFQDRGICWVNIQERVTVQDTTGASLLLGTGGNLARLDYVSRFIGSRHQQGMTQNKDSIFFFDSNTKSIYKLTGNQPENLGVIKGMSTYLYNNLLGEILTSDNPHLSKGLTASYDHKLNEAWFTFKDTILGTPNSFTLCYNDFINAFSSFYSYTPSIYINDISNIWSMNNTGSTQGVYRYKAGNFNEFFGTVIPSSVNLLLAPFPLERKVFDDAQWKTKVINSSGLEIIQETFNKVRYYNSAQDTGLRTFPTDTYVIGRRIENFWNNSGIRDRMIYSTNGSPTMTPGTGTLSTDINFSQRLRDSHIFCYLEYTPTANNSLVLDTYKIQYRKSFR